MNNDILTRCYWASLKDEDKKINKAQYRYMSLSQSGGSFCHPHLIIHKLSFIEIYLFNIKYSAWNKNQVIVPFKRYCFRATLKTKKCLLYNLTPFLLMVTFYVTTNHNSDKSCEVKHSGQGFVTWPSPGRTRPNCKEVFLSFWVIKLLETSKRIFILLIEDLNFVFCLCFPATVFYCHSIFVTYFTLSLVIQEPFIFIPRKKGKTPGYIYT